ncbi:MAG: hypothetical protein AAFY42_08285, partial [Pseudomonadota bacterium]
PETRTQTPSSGGGSGEFRSEIVAGEELSRQIEELIAYLNVVANDDTAYVHPEARRAVVRLGRYFFLYDEDKGSFWQHHWNNEYFDPSFDASVDPETVERARSIFKKHTRSYSRNPMYNDAFSAASQLHSAWLSKIPHESVTLIWAALETLFTMQGETGRAKDICRRASMFDEHSELRRLLLIQFSKSRNMIVHQKAGTNPMDGYELARDSSRLILWLIRWVLANGARFDSKDQFLRWLDLGKNSSRLRSEIKLRELALSHWRK